MLATAGHPQMRSKKKAGQRFRRAPVSWRSVILRFRSFWFYDLFNQLVHSNGRYHRKSRRFMELSKSLLRRPLPTGLPNICNCVQHYRLRAWNEKRSRMGLQTIFRHLFQPQRRGKSLLGGNNLITWGALSERSGNKRGKWKSSLKKETLNIFHEWSRSDYDVFNFWYSSSFSLERACESMGERENGKSLSIYNKLNSQFT